MKKIGTALAVLAAAAVMNTGTVQANENPTCILMKFTDDTRYDKIESAASLSDLVMEKLLLSGKFNLKETQPIDARLEALLYDERARELYGVKRAMAYGDYSAMFEGPGFNENKAQTIATAAVGQFLSPELTAPIGQAHGAEYLIQGTIINLGTGDWWDDKAANIASAVNQASGLLGTASSAALPLGILGAISVKRTGIGVQSDLRIIKASSGEVIWSKRVTAVADQKQIGIGLISVGPSKLSANLYSKAMDKAAQSIVDALVQDADEQKLFVK